MFFAGTLYHATLLHAAVEEGEARGKVPGEALGGVAYYCRV
jgi:hypothetical protein